MSILLGRLATRLGALLAALALSACASMVPPPEASSIRPLPSVAQAEDAWADVLLAHVDDRGRTDFRSIRDRDPAELASYVAWVYRTSPASDPNLFPTRNDQLAYYLNSYNALAMYNVIDDGIPETLAGYRKVPFFFFRKVTVGGEPMSLHAYENKVIRPLGEPRVHFALNCMARGCPRLPQRPFTAANLDAELDRQAREFFAEPRNLVVDDATRTIRLSSILKFYTADFLKVAPSLVDYVNRYRQPPIPADYKVAFIPYDWTINAQPPR